MFGGRRYDAKTALQYSFPHVVILPSAHWCMADYLAGEFSDR